MRDNPARLAASLTRRPAMSTTKTRPVVLTGDRTTGSLHLGHYVGSLKRRLELQECQAPFWAEKSGAMKSIV
jgi:hypothetical protein